jgi:uncharacterized protein (DUF2225 family)
MSHAEAYEVLRSHRDLFEYVETNQCAPDASNNRIQSVWEAFRTINPHYYMDWTCGSCVFRMMSAAHNLIKPVKHTFT